MARFPERRSFVQAVLDAVGRAGMAPVDMRYFAARPGAPAEYCRRRVRECDVVVVVIGFCYGTTVPGEMVSYAELEFTEAAAAGVPTLVFLLGEDADVPGVPADADHGRVCRFRQRLREAGMLVREFSTDAGLELEVFHALRDLRGSGQRAGMRYSLPPDTAAFTGRDAELDRISAAAARPGGVAAICAIGGMPGIGKTALAVHAAHLLRDRFPDGQLFVDLHAHTPGQEPVLPAAALAGLLAATGLDPRYLPDSPEDRAGLWRERMAGKRAVLLLDNSASTAQVTPLLPGGDFLVLVTSRRRLGDLPGAVTPVFLSALPPDEAGQMFIRLAPRAAHAPDGAVAEVAGLAGFLPLAISLLARVYAGHPSWTLADLAVETRAAALAMTAEHQTIAAAFGTSYRQLRPGRQRFFRLLGLHPGATTDAYAAAALAGTGLAAAAGHLDALHSEGLLTETGYRRYGMHDLIRRYARGHAAASSLASRDRAMERLFEYYQRTAAVAEALLARQTRPGPALAAPLPAVPVLGDAGQALAWVRAERVSLLACLDHAASAAQHAQVIALTAALAALWRWDGPWAEAMARHTAAVQAAQRLGDRLSQANALHDLGDVRRLVGEYPAATQAFEQALGIYRDLGDQLGQANALHGLGTVRWLTGEHPAAAWDFERALGIYRDLGDQLGEANALGNLGIVRLLMDEYPGAAPSQEQAPGTLRDLGHRLGEASALTYLGKMRRLTGDYPAAARDLERAFGIFRDLGIRGAEAEVLNEIGTLRRVSGDPARAKECHQQALELARFIASSWDEAHALAGLGRCVLATGNSAQAAILLRQAQQIFQRLGAADARAVLAELNALTSQLNPEQPISTLAPWHLP